jgi:nondiscriminating glutamyl-tRNA synthetase
VSTTVRARIAPSPTGTLHLGTARTALYNYLYAKKHKGTFVLRLEDTDEERSKDEFTKDILAGLKWLGLSWDEGPDIGGPYAPYKQTEKADHYERIAHKLIESGHAYFSYETPEELDAIREEQKERDQAPGYDNRGRHLTQEQEQKYQAEGRIPTVRFKIEETRTVSWNDHIKGQISIDTNTLGGDMVIVKSSGIAVYNFAVVVDDVDMKMTHVIRGEDHIVNTAKQILLYEALGYDQPEFAHCALILDIERHKLSKRKHGALVHIDQYRQDGYMPEAMVNYLAQMSWTPPDEREIFTLEEACEMFDLDKVSSSPAVFDLNKLKWFNAEYIRRLPVSLITERAKPFLTEFDLSGYSALQLEEMVASVRDGLTILSEVADAARFYFGNTIDVSSELKTTVLSGANAGKVLDKILQSLGQMPWGDHKGCKAIVDTIGKELGIKGKELYWPLRAALSGKTQGPDLGSLISVLGEKRVRARLEAALSCCSV